LLTVSGKRKNKRKKAAAKGKRQRRSATGQTHAKAATHAQIARPRVTEHNEITVVPVFPVGQAGPPSGSPGAYDVVFVLAYPA